MVKQRKDIQFYPEKGLGSYHFFGNGIPEEKTRKLYKAMVNQCGPYLSLPNAEEVLAIGLPKGFVEDCKAAGWTLVEAMTTARDYYAEKMGAPKARPTSGKADPEAKRLASILAGLTPNVPPAKLLTELKELVETKGETAVEMLTAMEKNNLRDPKGYIYMKKVTNKE